MNDTSLPVNRHPVDQLADIRFTIKKLQEREDELRSEVSALMGENDSLGGDEYIARQTVANRSGAIDTKALERDGIDVDKYRKAGTIVYTIRCESREQDAA